MIDVFTALTGLGGSFSVLLVMAIVFAATGLLARVGAPASDELTGAPT